MGIDYYNCQVCDEIFPDCGNYISCDCRVLFCCDECAQKGGMTESESGVIECSICRQEETTDLELLKFLLSHFKLNREKAVKLFYAAKK